KNKNVFVCPTVSNLNTFATVSWEPLGYDHGKGLPGNRHLTAGYGMNRVHWQNGPPNPSTGDNYGVPDASVANPAECILIEDTIRGGGSIPGEHGRELALAAAGRAARPTARRGRSHLWARHAPARRARSSLRQDAILVRSKESSP